MIPPYSCLINSFSRDILPSRRSTRIQTDIETYCTTKNSNRVGPAKPAHSSSQKAELLKRYEVRRARLGRSFTPGLVGRWKVVRCLVLCLSLCCVNIPQCQPKKGPHCGQSLAKKKPLTTPHDYYFRTPRSKSCVWHSSCRNLKILFVRGEQYGIRRRYGTLLRHLLTAHSSTVPPHGLKFEVNLFV